MSLTKRIVLFVCALVVLLLAVAAWLIYAELSKAASEDPIVWNDDIEEFGRTAPGAPGAVLFVGSSSIRLWDSLHADMAPFEATKRGFGGAKINDVIHHADRLFDVPAPAAVVVFVGTNDIHPGNTKPPEVMLDRFLEMMARLRAQHASVPVYYIAITPSLLRWEVWPTARETNRLITQAARTMPNTEVIDTGDRLLTGGQPNPDNYVFDGLHLSAQGYAIWTDIIRSRLIEDLGPPLP